MPTVNEEYFYELSRALGDAYLDVKRGIGTESTPGSALFEFNQLEYVANNGLPKFGILNTTIPDPEAGDPFPGFDVTYDETASPYFADVNAGYVSYAEGNAAPQEIIVQAQQVPIKRAFAATYPNTHKYGVKLGIPLSEIKKAVKSYTTSTSQAAVSTDEFLYIQDISAAEELGFPLKANVGNGFVIFNGFNDARTALRVDPSFVGVSGAGKLGVAAPALSRVYFLYDPRVFSYVGLPIDTSVTDPALFEYYPALPSDVLAIADILVLNPNDPVIETNGSEFAILRTVHEWPDGSSDAIFNPTDARLIVRASNNAQAALRSIRESNSIGDVIRGLEAYTTKLSGGNIVTFSQYWGGKSFKATNYFSRGISFEGYERFEFADSFRRAYNDAVGKDLPTTFGIFRGDLYGSNSQMVGSANVGAVTATSFLAGAAESILPRGTYIYGVSAVFESGETAPSYGTAIANTLTSNFFINEIKWNTIQLSGNDPLFYHVYRRSTTVGDISEIRLTEPNEIRSAGQFTALVEGSYATYETLNDTYEAIRITATGGEHLGGVGIKIRRNGTITNTSAYLTVKIFEDDGGVPPDVTTETPVAIGTNIPYSALGTGASILISYIESIDNPLTLGNPYWIVLQQSAAPTGGTIQIASNTTGTGQRAYSAAGVTFTSENSKSAYYKLYGYMDNGREGDTVVRRGVKRTGKISITSRRLRVYVPPVEATEIGRAPHVGAESESSTTESVLTKNELIVKVVARNGTTGTPKTFFATIPKGSPRGYQVLLGTAADVFDRVDDITVSPGSSLTKTSDNLIEWSLYDLVTVEAVP